MKCFKWRVKKTAAGDVVLHKRPIDDQQVVPVGDSVSLRSPGLDETPNYKNRMFCLYNISISDCNSIHVQSVTEGDQEYKLVVNDDNSEVQHDYLYLDFGQVHSPVTLYGYDVSDFSTSVYTSSFYAVFWSNYEKSAGAFHLQAVCADDINTSETTETESIVNNDP